MGYKKYAKFSPAAYNACDLTAKSIISKYLNSGGVYSLAEETHNVDVKALKPVFYEGEIKQGWVGDWPAEFHTVDIPKRKGRMLELYPNADLFFWVIAGDLKQAWEVPASSLKKEYLSKKDTSRGKKEQFYRIPISECRLIILEPT